MSRFLLFHYFFIYLFITVPVEVVAFDHWQINEIYSNEDGSAQFIEFTTTLDNQHSLIGVSIVSTNLDGTQRNTYTFPSNLGTTATSNHHLLLATPGFAELPRSVTPDYTLPFNFLFVGGGNVNFGASADMLNYGTLPTDGEQSLSRDLAVEASSPTNFTGETNSLLDNSYAIFDTDTGILRIPAVDVTDASGTTVYSASLRIIDAINLVLELVDAMVSVKTTSDPRFRDHAVYDVTTNLVRLPFVVVGTDILLVEMELIPLTIPMQFRVTHNQEIIRIFLEMDIVEDAALEGGLWPPLEVVRNGRTHTIETIYRNAGIDLTAFQEAVAVADIRIGTRRGQPYNNAELHEFMRTYLMDILPAPETGKWHFHGVFLTTHERRVLGTMYTGSREFTPINERRRGFAIFVDQIEMWRDDGFTTSSGGVITPAQGFLRTTVHELGHALNLLHEDGDGNETIMNQTGRLGGTWDYRWSERSLTHFDTHPRDRMEPGVDVDFSECHDEMGVTVP